MDRESNFDGIDSFLRIVWRNIKKTDEKVLFYDIIYWIFYRRGNRDRRDKKRRK